MAGREAQIRGPAGRSSLGRRSAGRGDRGPTTQPALKFDRILAAALAAGALSSLASVARAAALPPPAGDAVGIELARKVKAHYAAPATLGVEMRSALPGGLMSMKLVLKRGRTTATVMAIAFGKERITSVFNPRGAFMRGRGERCWTKLMPGVPGASSPMIAMRGARFLAPEPIGELTRLEVVERDPETRAAVRTAYKIDAETGRLAAMVVDGIAITVRTLPRAPVVPEVRPVCKA